jgi:hypothetical protein
MRQLRDWKMSAVLEEMIPQGMKLYAWLCGWTLARAHAQSGDRIAIAAYLGNSTKFDNAIADFAETYADQNLIMARNGLRGIRMRRPLHTEAEAAAEAWQDSGHVFTLEDGRPLDPAYVTRLFQQLRRGPGGELPALTFHGLRHCTASLMLASGADIAVVSKLMGHASVGITSDGTDTSSVPLPNKPSTVPRT